MAGAPCPAVRQDLLPLGRPICSEDPCVSGVIVHGFAVLPPYGDSVPLHEQQQEISKFVSDFGGQEAYDRAKATGTISSEWCAVHRTYHPPPGGHPYGPRLQDHG